MRNLIPVLLLSLFLLAGTSPSYAQKNKDPRLASGKNLRNTILSMLRSAKEVKGKPQTCDAAGLLRSIPRSKLVPTKEALKKEIANIMDSLQPGFYDPIRSPFVLEYFNDNPKFLDFLFKVTDKDFGDIHPDKRKKIRAYHNRLKNALKNGFDLKKVEFDHKGCKVTSSTNLKPLKWTIGKKKDPFAMELNWEITTKLDIVCNCTKSNKFKVKNIKYTYSGKTTGPMMFNKPDYLGRSMGNVIIMYGLRFGKVTQSQYSRTKLECCPTKPKTTEDGSFTDPNDEDIGYETFLDTSVGVSFGSDEETEAIGAAGVLFPVTEIGSNPLYIGPKATVNTTALNGNEFKATRVLIGPTAEYQIPVGAGSTNIITGLNSGFFFGKIDAFGTKRTTSGFAVNAYTGAQFGIGPNLGLSVLLNFFEFNNTTVKIDEDDFKSTSSNTTFLTDRAAVTVGVRVGLD